ncbi:DUF1801 domain-containing protein [Lysobacter sp. Root983]|uniref:iron chaperone n=1 Tax=Lysobacter sp. Root983 TaxID=1736613 RepID=UPI00070FC283|nr:DUF1801 domain-containing protein [Lysobacter sp. Root983]KRD74586.1 hypothetical protein ASE43_15245 [Lysobacter sp. Root983]
MTAKKKAAPSKTPSKAFSAEERAAMKERAKELKAQASKAESEKDLIAKIGEMPPADRAIAKKLHGIVTEVAPHLFPKTWYGMPAYANEDGKILCFLQAASKFGSRYATFGFNDVAQLDDGEMWPTAFALKSLDAAEEKKIRALLKKALG